MTGPKPRPGVLEISPYVAGEANVQGATNVIKLASNESALGASPKARAAYESVSATLHRYPDGASFELRQVIGRIHGIGPAQIVCGAGSDEILSLLGLIYAGPGDEILYSQYGFLMYKILALAVGATPVVAPETGYRTDVDAILAGVSERTRMVILANPNNPTGTYISVSEIQSLRAALRDDIVLVIDAAYAEYVDAEGQRAARSAVASDKSCAQSPSRDACPRSRNRSKTPPRNPPAYRRGRYLPASRAGS